MLEKQGSQIRVNLDIGIEIKNRREIVRLLNILLADEYKLFTKSYNYHWKVVGKDFKEYHEFFQWQYEQLYQIIDDVAERVRQLGGLTISTINEYLQITNLKENPGEYSSTLKMISNLLKDHNGIIKYLRKSAKDGEEEYKNAGTNDFMIV